METVAYYLALVSVMAVPAGLAAWVVLHVFAPRWRGVGQIAVRAITVVVVFAVMGAVFLIRGPALRLHRPFVVGED